MDRHEAGALTDGIENLRITCRPLSVVQANDNRIRVRQVLWPVFAGPHDGVNIRVNLVQRPGDQNRAGHELVITRRPVCACVTDEDNLCHAIGSSTLTFVVENVLWLVVCVDSTLDNADREQRDDDHNRGACLHVGTPRRIEMSFRAES